MMKRHIVALAFSLLFATSALSAQTFEEYMVMMDSLSIDEEKLRIFGKGMETDFIYLYANN